MSEDKTVDVFGFHNAFTISDKHFVVSIGNLWICFCIVVAIAQIGKAAFAWKIISQSDAYAGGKKESKKGLIDFTSEGFFMNL